MIVWKGDDQNGQLRHLGPKAAPLNQVAAVRHGYSAAVLAVIIFHVYVMTMGYGDRVAQ